MRLLPKAAVAALLTPSVLTAGVIPFAQLQKKSGRYSIPVPDRDATDYDLPIPAWFSDAKSTNLRIVNLDQLDPHELLAYQDYLQRWQEIREKDPTPPPSKRPVSDAMRYPTRTLNAMRAAARAADLEAERSAPATPPLTVLPDPPKKQPPPLPYQLPDFLR